MTAAQITDRHIENPFTIQFSIVFWDAYGLWENEEKPFSERWHDLWAAAPDTVYGPNQEKVASCRKSFEKFERDDGFCFLEELFEKGADPNFILVLFVQYLWDNEVPENENDAPDLNVWKDLLIALRLVRQNYERTRGADDQFVQQLRSDEEVIDRYFIRPKDTRSNKKHPPSDKINRVIFCLYEHARQRTGGPQWQLLLELSESAGVIRPKSFASPHGYLKSHIKYFEKDHPKEAAFLRNDVLKGTRPFWKARSETLPPLKPYTELI